MLYILAVFVAMLAVFQFADYAQRHPILARVFVAVGLAVGLFLVAGLYGLQFHTACGPFAVWVW